MGRAARAKESRGNPEPPELMARYITNDAFREAMGRGIQFRATYSDREYVMDQHGTMRRTSPTTQTLSTRHPDQ